jgi:glycosyltransferase involved in cell wall biosynthesis
LTLGGWVPHKRQHLIPEVAARLKESGVSFHWQVAGPAGRISGYKAAVDAELVARGLTKHVTAHEAVPIDQLAKLYDTAHLYVQPSTEEGFCITALDAAAAGIPVIASPAGALPKIAEASGGRLVASEAMAIAAAVLEFHAAAAWPDDSREVAQKVIEEFSWTEAARQLVECYNDVASALGKRSRPDHNSIQVVVRREEPNASI